MLEKHLYNSIFCSIITIGIIYAYGYFDMTVIMHDAVSEKNELRG